MSLVKQEVNESFWRFCKKRLRSGEFYFILFFCTVHCNTIIQYNIPYHKCIYNRLPVDEPSGSKHVEDIKH